MKKFITMLLMMFFVTTSLQAQVDTPIVIKTQSLRILPDKVYVHRMFKTRMSYAYNNGLYTVYWRKMKRQYVILIPDSLDSKKRVMALL